MLRIVHISDLHIRDESLDNDKLSVLQAGAKAVLKRNGLEVHAGGHDPRKLEWLRERVIALRPRIIVVTGDLTNFGDAQSFKLAGEYLAALRESSGAESVLCVPGNHDCLVERAALIERAGGWRDWLVRKVVAKLNRETEVMTQAAREYEVQHGKALAKTPFLLDHYARLCERHEFGVCHPGQPVRLDARWGHVSFFSFNSVNGGGLMANKGQIGEAQFATFRALCDGDAWKEHKNGIRIALLHHHPISSPQSMDADYNRAYDWMDDGPHLLKVLNSKEFHFVLHGHQHEPFTCAVDYGRSSQKQTLIVAAGSATQGLLPERNNSFNVIDLLNPFEARVRRYELKNDSEGFELNSDAERIYPLRSVDEVRLGAMNAPLSDHDMALRALIRNSFRDFESTGDGFAYSELEFDVRIDDKNLYSATYRRKGRVLTEDVGDGLVFVITGSPSMDCRTMQLRGLDWSSGQSEELAPPKLKIDEPKRKEILVRTRQALRPGDAFDLALSFVWQASDQERNDFDAVSLMGLREPVGLLRYRVELPRRAAQLKIQSIGTAMAHIADVQPMIENLPGGHWRYTFELRNPPPVVYVISFDI